MDSQQPSLDLSALAHALPAPPLPAQENNVVASLSTLPPELKLKIVEEVYELTRKHEEPDDFWLDPSEKPQRSPRWWVDRDRPADLALLSLVNKEWHALCVPKLWETFSCRLYDRPLASLFGVINEVLPKYGQHLHMLVLYHYFVKYIFSDDLAPFFRTIEAIASTGTLQSLALILDDSLVSHPHAIANLCRLSPQLESLVLTEGTENCGAALRVAEAVSSLQRLRSLNLRGIYPDLLAHLRPPSPLEHIEIERVWDFYMHGDFLDDFLSSYASTLKILVLKEVYGGSDFGPPEFNLPSLTHLVLTSSSTRSFPLAHFQQSPISHLHFASERAPFFGLLPFLDKRAATLRSFVYFQETLYVPAESIKEVEEEAEAVKAWCERHDVKYRLPAVKDIKTRPERRYGWDE